MPLDDNFTREMTDTGIRFLSWGDNATRLYSGSSDGVVKIWDVTKNEADTFVKDLITTDSGIMSGALSPDKSRLVLGEVNGSINILEVGRENCEKKDSETLRFVPYVGEDDEDDDDNSHAPEQDSGAAIATNLIKTGQMQHVPMGSLPIRQTVQGPKYAGPFDCSVDAPFLRQQALEQQLKFSRDTGSRCDIPGCEDIMKITSEETGDSGRSIDRIPDELRKQWKAGSNSKPLPGKARCISCGRAARPSTHSHNDDDDTAIHCERCSFACFRCGAPNEVPPSTTTLTCTNCKCEWEIGALGYSCVKDTGKVVVDLDVPTLKRYARKLHKNKMKAHVELGDNASFGDEMNALTDYYLRLAVSRPESPPL